MLNVGSDLHPSSVVESDTAGRIKREKCISNFQATYHSCLTLSNLTVASRPTPRRTGATTVSFVHFIPTPTSWAHAAAGLEYTPYILPARRIAA